MQVCERLPVVAVEWRVEDEKEADGKGRDAAGEARVLQVNIRRTGGRMGGGSVPMVYAPRFPKVTRLPQTSSEEGERRMEDERKQRKEKETKAA